MTIRRASSLPLDKELSMQVVNTEFRAGGWKLPTPESLGQRLNALAKKTSPDVVATGLAARLKQFAKEKRTGKVITTLHAIRETKNPELGGVARAYLHHASAGVRKAAGKTLLGTLRADAFEPLARAIEREKNPAVLRHHIYALSQAGQAAVPVLVTLANRPHKRPATIRSRLAAVTALGPISHPEASLGLSDIAVNANHWDVRRTAVQTLGRHGTREAAEALLILSFVSDPRLSQSATNALERNPLLLSKLRVH